MTMVVLVFAGASAAQAQDLTDAGRDRFTDFASTYALASGTDAFVIENSHFNSNENFTIDTMFYLTGGKLRTAIEIFTLNEGGCGYEMRHVPVYAMRDAKDARYGSIAVRVTQTVTHTDEECDAGTKLPRAGKHIYTDIYRWDATKHGFVTRTNALSDLIPPEQ